MTPVYLQVVVFYYKMERMNITNKNSFHYLEILKNPEFKCNLGVSKL